MTTCQGSGQPPDTKLGNDRGVCPECGLAMRLDDDDSMPEHEQRDRSRGAVDGFAAGGQAGPPTLT